MIHIQENTKNVKKSNENQNIIIQGGVRRLLSKETKTDSTYCGDSLRFMIGNGHSASPSFKIQSEPSEGGIS